MTEQEKFNQKEDKKMWYAVIFSIGIIIGVLTVKQPSIDFNKQTADIISCNYEEDFLKSTGFTNKEDCQKLNLAVYNQYSENCLKNMKSTKYQDADKVFLDECIYYSFAKQEIPLRQEYLEYSAK